jgi:hypothetical protein
VGLQNKEERKYSVDHPTRRKGGKVDSQKCSIHGCSLQTRRPFLRPLPLLMHSTDENKASTAATCAVSNCFIAVVRVCSAKQRYGIALHQARDGYHDRFAAALCERLEEVRVKMSCMFHGKSLRSKDTLLIGWTNLDLAVFVVSARI